MTIEYATTKDRQELLDFLLTVFKEKSPEHAPFEDIYPDLFLANDETMGRHAVIREDGRIVAAVGTYPTVMQIFGCHVKNAGVGQVATAKACTGKGYMTALLKSELERCRREGCVFAWLGGRLDRYRHFGFESCGLSFDHCTDAHALRDVPKSRTISKVDAKAPGAITEELFALREKTVNSLLYPIDILRLQMTRRGFEPEIWTATPAGATTPDAWAIFDRKVDWIIEWCGSFEGRTELARAIAEDGVDKVWVRCPPADTEMAAFLRPHCRYMAPISRVLCVLDADALVEAYRPLIPKDFVLPPPGTPATELARKFFGPERGSACLPVEIPVLFHV